MTRICQHCGETLIRDPRSNMRDWLGKRFCSQTCRYHGDGESSAALGSRQLLERSFELYSRVAAERGLAGPWEAAVVLGMAA